MKPQLSIIVPLFNRADLIAETIQSVMNQSCADWELLLVDDHSTDDSFGIASKFAELDSRIRCWSRKSPVKGAPSCRNEGFLESTAEFVIFLDSDDLLAPHCVESRLAQFEQHPENDFLVFAMQLFDREVGDSQDVWCFKSDDYLTEFLACPLWQTSCPIWRRNSFQKIGAWKQGLPSWQDWELHVRTLCANPKFAVFDELIDCFYRRGDTGRISVGSTGKSEHLNARIDTCFEVGELLQGGNQFTPQRKIALTRQITRVIVLQKIIGEATVAEANLQRLIVEKYVLPDQINVLRSYLDFEAKSFWRKPLLNKTFRRLLKFYYHCQIPQHIHRSGVRKLRLGVSS